MQELLKRIKELEELANKTDSKKEDLKYRLEIAALRRKLEEYYDNLIDHFPDEVTLTIQLNKTVTYNTSYFKDWLLDYIQGNDYELDNLDLNKELKDYIYDGLEVCDFVDDADYNITVDGLE